MIIDYLLAFSLIIISLAMIILTTFSRIHLNRSFPPPILINLIYFFIYVKLILYYLLPSILRLFSNFQFEREDRVAPIELLHVYCIELISWLIWFVFLHATLLLFARTKETVQDNTFLFSNKENSNSLLLIISLGFIYVLSCGLLKTEIPPYIEVFRSIFFFAGLSIGPLFVILSKELFNKKFFYFGLILCIFNVLTLSTRGAVIYLLLFCYYLAWFVSKDVVTKRVLVGFTFTLAIFYFILGGLVTGSISINETGETQIDIGAKAEKNEGRSSLEEIEWRFGASTRMGTVFIKLFDNDKAAGILPIKHSLMGILPRTIYLEKPIPSTLDPDDIFSQGMYIIYREIHGYDTFSMSEFPSGAHFYWEFGIYGVLFLSAISAIYVSLFTVYISRLGAVSIPLLISVFKPWGYMDPKIWVSDIILQIYQNIIPALILYLLILALLIIKKSMQHVLKLSLR